eukprot:10688614-Alexandrium_andersonii.AAC.1
MPGRVCVCACASARACVCVSARRGVCVCASARLYVCVRVNARACIRCARAKARTWTDGRMDGRE